MPARLVYAPKAYVFTKNSTGDVLNLTDYVTAGQVQRLTNQASTASVTLRNPNRTFTIPSNPTFCPMDGITIYLERIKGYPIQVFTGYLDSSPYYQMFPGTVTLTATCTIKRLMYTYFDPSLQYVQGFFYQYGWMNNGSGGLQQLNATGNTTTVNNGINGNTNNTLQDGSIGKLLYATLTDIGEWDDTNIWIENLPAGVNGLGARIAQLMASLASNQATAASDYTQFLDASLGSGTQGSGGGAAGPNSGTASYGNAPKTPSNGYTKATWAAALLSMLSITPSNVNMQALVGWMNAEGGNWANSATYNPLNTTMGSPGAGNTGSQGNIKVYASWAKGLVATAKTLTKDDPSVVTALQSGTVTDIAAAIGASTWNRNSNGTQNAAYTASVAQCISSASPNLGGTKVPGVSTTTGASGTSPANLSTGNNPRGTAIVTAGQGSGSSSTSTKTPSGSGQMSCIDAIISACATINNKKMPYVYAGGHAHAGTPDLGPPVGFDCSGSVAAVLSAGGVIAPGSLVGADNTLVAGLQSAGQLNPGPGSGSSYVTLYDYPGKHIYLEVNGQNFGTYGGGGSGMNSFQGPGWLPAGPPPPAVEGANVSITHLKDSVLNQSVTYNLSLGNTSTGAGGAGGNSGNMIGQATAEAFTTTIDLPSLQDMSTAIVLGGEGKGLMHDENLLPFVQQLTQASMRSFQSLPNGDFYAFYPDYFGEFDHHPAYWQIPDIEILTGDIYLNDQSLVTHQYATGDNTYPAANNDLYNEMFSTGVVTVYNAFTPGDSIISKGSNVSSVANKGGAANNGLANVMGQAEATAFVKRYGARPNVMNYPQVRSSIFEMYLAYQQFMLSWSNQFTTNFSFTFMPELYPGGKVAFPQHGLQMYISSVTHSWDYVDGFTTDAVLTAPSQVGSGNPDLPPNMVQALVNPVRATVQVVAGNRQVHPTSIDLTKQNAANAAAQATNAPFTQPFGPITTSPISSPIGQP